MRNRNLGLTKAEMTKVVFRAILDLVERDARALSTALNRLSAAAYDLFPGRKLTQENVDLAINDNYSNELMPSGMIAAHFIKSMRLQFLATQAEVEELRAENQRLQKIIDDSRRFNTHFADFGVAADEDGETNG